MIEKSLVIDGIEIGEMIHNTFNRFSNFGYNEKRLYDFFIQLREKYKNQIPYMKKSGREEIRDYYQVFFGILGSKRSMMEDFSSMNAPHNFSYIVELENFINMMSYNIDDDGSLSFIKYNFYVDLFGVKEDIIEETGYFLSNYDELFDRPKKLFNRTMSDHTLFDRIIKYQFEKVRFGWEELFALFEEIINDENWKFSVSQFDPEDDDDEAFLFDEKVYENFFKDSEKTDWIFCPGKLIR